LSTHRDVIAATARVDALRARDEKVERHRVAVQTRGTNHDVERLLADPKATVTSPDLARQLEAEHSTLLRAINAAEADVDRAKFTASVEFALGQRVAKRQLGEDLIDLLEEAERLLRVEVGYHARLMAADYRADHVLPRLGSPDDADVIARLVSRVRERLDAMPA
jgi:hypothetical protein